MKLNLNSSDSNKKQLTRCSGLHPSVHSVISNDDLLTEILLKLPITPLLSFKRVSKHWLHLIKDPHFSLRLAHRPKIDPPSALYIKRTRLRDPGYDMLSYKTSRFRTARFRLGEGKVSNGFEILQSCNGLVVCSVGEKPRRKIFVGNPTVGEFKRLYKCQYGSLRLVFDPRRSLGFKVYHAQKSENLLSTRLRVFCPEAENWSDYGVEYPADLFVGFGFGVCWNGELHWLNIMVGIQPTHYKLGFVNERPVLTKIELPQLHLKLYSDIKMFESGESLVLVCWDYGYWEKHLGVYVMRNGCSDWRFKYFVDLRNVLRESGVMQWRIRRSVMCAVLGEREEDSFMLIEMDDEVVQYNFKLKTSRTIRELGSHCPKSCFQYIMSLAHV